MIEFKEPKESEQEIQLASSSSSDIWRVLEPPSLPELKIVPPLNLKHLDPP
jgi:hypothetical protein